MSTVEDQFEAIADDYTATEEDKARNSYEYDVNWPSIRSLLPEPPAHIMDYGAGAGSFSKIMVADGYTIVATDNAPSMVAKLQQQGLEGKLWHYADEPFDQPFDAVVAKLVVQFIDDLSGFASSIRQNLTEQGLLIISVPHPDRSRPQLADGATYKTEIGKTGLFVDMIHREQSEYETELKKAGFALLKTDAPTAPNEPEKRRLNLLFQSQ